MACLKGVSGVPDMSKSRYQGGEGASAGRQFIRITKQSQKLNRIKKQEQKARYQQTPKETKRIPRRDQKTHRGLNRQTNNQNKCRQYKHNKENNQ